MTDTDRGPAGEPVPTTKQPTAPDTDADRLLTRALIAGHWGLACLEAVTFATSPAVLARTLERGIAALELAVQLANEAAGGSLRS